MCHVNLHKHKSLLFNSKFNTHKFTHVYLPIYIFSPFPQSVLFRFPWYNFFYGVSLYTCRYTHTHTPLHWNLKPERGRYCATFHCCLLHCSSLRTHIQTHTYAQHMPEYHLLSVIFHSDCHQSDLPRAQI